MFAPFFVLFGLMAIGYFSKKLNWLDDSKNEGIGNILVNVAFPCLLVSSMIEIEIQGTVLFEFIEAALASAIFYGLYALLALLYIRIAKIPKKLGSMVQLSMLTSNNGFMGLPITLAFFGKPGLIPMIANNMTMGIIVFSYGVYVLKRSKIKYEGGEKQERNTIRNFFQQLFTPMMAGIFVGLFIGIFRLNSFIPDALVQLISILGGLATPLSMMYIGATLYNSSFSSLFKNPLVLGVSITRLTVFAAFTFALLYFLPIASLMKQILFLVITLPSASVVPVVTAQYGTGSEESVNIVVLSTLLSLGITPLGVYLALSFL